MFGSTKDFNPEKDVPDLGGKIILVTGGNTGLGLQTIYQLAPHKPAKIYMGARTASKAQSAIAELRSKIPDIQIEHLPLDLTSFASIQSAAELFKRQESRLDILINNAGVMATPWGTTKEGYEIQFGTNHMGHALLTKLLLPVLEKTAAEPNSDVRIVNVTSMGHYGAPSSGIIWGTEKLKSHSTWTRYGQSKLSNILFTIELAHRYPNITSIAVHPGVILTDLYLPFQTNTFWKFGYWMFAMFAKILPGVLPNAFEGAKNQVWAATAPRGTVKNGKYYVPVGKWKGGSKWAKDEGLAKKLWEWTDGEFEKHGVKG